MGAAMTMVLAGSVLGVILGPILIIWWPECVPRWARSRWPFRRWFWQADQLEAARRRAHDRHRQLWGDE